MTAPKSTTARDCRLRSARPQLPEVARLHLVECVGVPA